MKMLYHIALESDWLQTQETGIYKVSKVGKSLDEEGYIHLSFAYQVKQVADSIYSDKHNLVLLKINPEKLKFPVKVEPPPGLSQRFPHLYGPLDITAVEEVLAYNSIDGVFPEVNE